MLWKHIWLFLLRLLISYFGAVQSIYVTTDQPDVVVNVGNNATLDCTYRTNVGSMFSLEWRFATGTKADAEAMKILYYTDGKTYTLGPQANRIKLIAQNPIHGVASIRIENTRSSDTGRYSCDINNPPDFTGPTEAFVNLIVRVPPSTPECKVIGKPYIGNNVTLLCSSTEGRPTPKYIWSEVNPGTAEPSSKVMIKGLWLFILVTPDQCSFLKLNRESSLQCPSNGKTQVLSLHLSHPPPQLLVFFHGYILNLQGVFQGRNFFACLFRLLFCLAPLMDTTNGYSDGMLLLQQCMTYVLDQGLYGGRQPTSVDLGALLTKDDSNKGTLFLRNLTMEYSGTYRCVASNVLGEQSCQLVLTVTVNNEAGVVVGAVVATLIALLLIAVVTYYLLRHRRKSPKTPVVGHELREDAVAPGKEANSHLLVSSVHSQKSNSDSMNSKYNIVV
ncbi:V-set and immunoglobulin domain-containing protein 2-like [Carcharodon carcharias]|uniref:V-set and immunoglobulin domain-containing protein 2-like n=1 Tax=Carcharodon carcharias TaxID=13397 RepID=UPI001B7E5FEA|nr:V-set and immunoglobulin domain-containing protein 2-like [Carcharodon carcharias]